MFAFNGILLFAAAIYGYSIKRKRIYAGLWCLFNILFGLWNLAFHKATVSAETAFVNYWFKTWLISFIFLLPVFFHLLSLYLKKVLPCDIFFFYPVSILFSIILIFRTQYFIGGIDRTPYGFFMLKPGLFFHVFSVIFYPSVISGIGLLFSSRRDQPDLNRNQKIWFGMGLLFWLFALTNVVLNIYKITPVQLTVFFIIPYILITGYAVSRTNVSEVDIFARKTIISIYFLLLVLFIHLAVVHMLHKIIGIDYLVSSGLSGAIIMLNILFTLHYGGIERLNTLTNRAVYEKKDRYYRFLQIMQDMSQKIEDAQTLTVQLLKKLVNTVKVGKSLLYLADEYSGYFQLKYAIGIDTETIQKYKKLPPAHSLINRLKGHGFLEIDLVKEAETLKKSGIRYVISLYKGWELYGFIGIGDKLDNSEYDREDIDILNSFGRYFVIFLDNIRLRSRALEDELTGLYRHAYFYKRLEEEIEHSIRYKRAFSLLIIDVDDFKTINDSFGHQIGNRVLKRIGIIIKSIIRKTDIAARFGGEEFVIIMPETKIENAMAAAERIRRRVEQDFRSRDSVQWVLGRHLPKNVQFRITVSVGVSSYREGKNAHDIISEADRALYCAKSRGKNCIFSII